MNMQNFLQAMKHSPIQNYGGIPGLTSWLIGAPGEHGLVRLMECSREHQEPIIPHSHRFNFRCLVLAGTVRNLVWKHGVKHGDEYQMSLLGYRGKPGEYAKQAMGVERWAVISSIYHEGQEYGMAADEVHSIFFSRGACVLFFEGPKVSDSSVILEPVVDGVVIPTFKVEPWMFKKGEAA